jgi:hypothetical protein
LDLNRGRALILSVTWKEGWGYNDRGSRGSKTSSNFPGLVKTQFASVEILVQIMCLLFFFVLCCFFFFGSTWI